MGKWMHMHNILYVHLLASPAISHLSLQDIAPQLEKKHKKHANISKEGVTWIRHHTLLC